MIEKNRIYQELKEIVNNKINVKVGSNDLLDYYKVEKHHRYNLEDYEKIKNNILNKINLNEIKKINTFIIYNKGIDISDENSFLKSKNVKRTQEKNLSLVQQAHRDERDTCQIMEKKINDSMLQRLDLKKIESEGNYHYYFDIFNARLYQGNYIDKELINNIFEEYLIYELGSSGKKEYKKIYNWYVSAKEELDGDELNKKLFEKIGNDKDLLKKIKSLIHKREYSYEYSNKIKVESWIKNLGLDSGSKLVNYSQYEQCIIIECLHNNFVINLPHISGYNSGYAGASFSLLRAFIEIAENRKVEVNSYICYVDGELNHSFVKIQNKLIMMSKSLYGIHDILPEKNSPFELYEDEGKFIRTVKKYYFKQNNKEITNNG